MILRIWAIACEQLIKSANWGDTKIAFELVQTGVNDQPECSRPLLTISQMDTLGGQDLSTSLVYCAIRLLNDPNLTYKQRRQLGMKISTKHLLTCNLPQYSWWLVQFSIIASIARIR